MNQLITLDLVVAFSLLTDDYYAQFISDELKQLIKKRFSIQFLQKCYNKNNNFEDIGIMYWDEIISKLSKSEMDNMRNKFKLCGDFSSRGGMINVAKVAAKQICEQEINK